MGKLSNFLLYVEHYVKTVIDFDTVRGLDEKAYERLLTKAAIEISRRTSPKQVYSLDRDQVREFVHDVISDLMRGKAITPETEHLYSVINNLGEPIYVFARYKKDALDTLKSATHLNIKYWGSKKTLHKVVSVNSDRKAVLDNGEERGLGTTLNFVNLYGHGRNLDE